MNSGIIWNFFQYLQADAVPIPTAWLEKPESKPVFGLKRRHGPWQPASVMVVARQAAKGRAALPIYAIAMQV